MTMKKVADMSPEEYLKYRAQKDKEKQARQAKKVLFSSESNPNAQNPNVLPVSQEGVPVGTPPIEHKPGVAEKEYLDFLQQTLGVSSLLISLLVCYLCAFPLELAEELAFTQEEVLEISEPAARLLAKSKLPAQTRKIIVSSGDVIGVSVALTAYVVRVLSLLQEKQKTGAIRHVPSQQTTRVQSPAPPTGAHNGTSSVDIGALSGWGGFSN